MYYLHNFKKYDKTYFLEYIQNEECRIEKFLCIQEKCITEEQVSKCNLILFHLYKNIIYCNCTLKKLFNVEYDERFFNIIKNYSELAHNLQHQLPECEKIDSLAINFLFLDNSETAFGSFHSKLKELSKYDVYKMLYSKSKEDLPHYMNEQWYEECSSLNFAWYNTHLNDTNTYVGYISFVGSAIAKKIELDISNINYLIR